MTTYVHKTLGREAGLLRDGYYAISVPGDQVYPRGLTSGLPKALIENSTDREKVEEVKDWIDDVIHEHDIRGLDTHPKVLREAIEKHMPAPQRKFTNSEVVKRVFAIEDKGVDHIPMVGTLVMFLRENNLRDNED